MTSTAAEEKALLLSKAKTEYGRTVDSGTGPTFEAAWAAGKFPNLKKKYEAIVEGGRYYYGWIVIFNWTKPLLDRLDPRVAGIDAGHCSSDAGGIVLALDFVDCNRSIIPGARAHISDNERGHTWSLFLAFLVLWLPELNSSSVRVTIMRDGKREISEKFRLHLPNAMLFLCLKHALLAAFRASIGPGDQVKETMTDLVCTLSLTHFNSLESRLSAPFQRYLTQNTHIEKKG